MKSNYSSWPTIILFLHFKFHFLLLFTALEQELYCCAKSAKKITPDRLWHSSLKKQTGQTPCESGESRPRRTCASASIRKGDGRGQHPFWPCDPRECGHFCSCYNAWPCLCCSPEGRAQCEWCLFQGLRGVGHMPGEEELVQVVPGPWLILPLDRLGRSCLFQFSSCPSHLVGERLALVLGCLMSSCGSPFSSEQTSGSEL